VEGAAAFAPTLIGRPLRDATDSAETAGYTLRVIRADRPGTALTADFRSNRITVVVDSTDVVVDIHSTG
jgi:hypothetical protein